MAGLRLDKLRIRVCISLYLPACIHNCPQVKTFSPLSRHKKSAGSVDRGLTCVMSAFASPLYGSEERKSGCLGSPSHSLGCTSLPLSRRCQPTPRLDSQRTIGVGAAKSSLFAAQCIACIQRRANTSNWDIPHACNSEAFFRLYGPDAVAGIYLHKAVSLAIV